MPESVVYNLLAPSLILLLLGLARPAGSSLHVLVPGLTALTVASSSLRGVGTTVSFMRAYGSWRTLQASAIPASLYLAGLVGSRIVRTVLVVAFMFLVAMAGLGYRTEGNLFVLMLYVLLGTAMFSALGMFFAYVIRSPQAVSGAMNLVLLPMVFLSNVLFIGREEWLRKVSLLLPLTYLSDLIRNHLQGLGFGRETWLNLAVLTAWLVLSSWAALELAKRRVEEE
jgi:ABC-2 type transport system permease protein